MTVRTLFMTADAVGGVWQYATDMAEGLATRGISTYLAILGPEPSRDQRERASRIPGLSLDYCSLPLEWTARSPADVLAASMRLGDMAARVNADVIQLNSPAFAAFGTFAGPFIAVQHSCLLTWWATVRGGSLPDDFRWRAEINGRGLHAAQAVVTPSAALAELTARLYRLPNEPRVVFNGRSSAYRPGAGEPADFVFTAGRLWDDAKNVAVLDRAARYTDTPILAAGSLYGPNGEAAHFPNLRCLGELAESSMAAYFCRRPIYISTALYEPFGLAVLEAAQAGCALILADIPSFRELWHDVADFVPPDNEKAIAAAIEVFVADPKRRAAFGAAAQERSKRYSVSAMVAEMLAVYASVEETELMEIE